MLANPFEYEEEKKQERCYWRRVGFLGWLAIALILIAIPMLTSCAAEPQKKEPQVCYLGLIGQTEEGYTVVMQQCISQEAFKESQKK